MPDSTTNDSIQPAAVQQSAAPTSPAPPQPPALPVATAAPPAPPAQPTPQQRAAVAQVAHHTALGILAQKLFSGGHNEYTVDPQTGQTQQTFVKDPPGQIFRNIVGGFLLGGAAASAGTRVQDAEGNERRVPAQGFLGGAALGGAAVMQQQRALDEQRYERAQNQYKNQRDAQQQNQEGILRAAQLEHSRLETYKLARDLDIHSPDVISQANSAFDAKAQAAQEVGGHESKIIIDGRPWNGQAGNAEDFYGAYNRNPEQFKSPPGFERLETISVDISGLHYDEHTDPATGQTVTRWLDKQGNPVDMDQHTRITFYDVPLDSREQLQNITGAQLIKLNPNLKDSLDPDQTYRLPFSTILSAAQMGVKDLNDTIRAKAAATRAGAAKTSAAAKAAGKSKGTNADEIRNLNQQRLIASNELASAAKNFDDAGITAARTKLDGIEAQLKQLRTPTQSAGVTRVLAPDGTVRAIPNAQLQAALAAGGKVVQ